MISDNYYESTPKIGGFKILLVDYNLSQFEIIYVIFIFII